MLFVHVSGGLVVWSGVRCPCPSVRKDIVIPLHLFKRARKKEQQPKEREEEELIKKKREAIRRRNNREQKEEQQHEEQEKMQTAGHRIE